MSTLTENQLLAILAGGSALSSAALSYAVHGDKQVNLPLVGSVSAPVAFAAASAISAVVGTMAVFEKPLPAKWFTGASAELPLANEIIYGQTLSGLTQSAIMKGFTNNPNVGLAESFAFGFISPIIGSELAGVALADYSFFKT